MPAPSLVSELTMIDRNGPSRQDRVERRQAIHVGHLHVQRDHVRPHRVEDLQRLAAIAGHADHLHARRLPMLSAMIARITAESSTTRTRITSDTVRASLSSVFCVAPAGRENRALAP